MNTWLLTTDPPFGVIPRPRPDDWLPDDLEALASAGVGVLVTLLVDPELRALGLGGLSELAEARGLRWLHCPVQDRATPDSTLHFHEAVELALAARRAGDGVVAHCRQGIGRSSLFIAALLVAEGVPSAEAWSSLERARGRPVPDTDAQREWLEGYSAWRRLR